MEPDAGNSFNFNPALWFSGGGGTYQEAQLKSSRIYHSKFELNTVQYPMLKEVTVYASSNSGRFKFEFAPWAQLFAQICLCKDLFHLDLRPPKLLLATFIFIGKIPMLG